jgi:hypothetical protein
VNHLRTCRQERRIWRSRTSGTHSAVTGRSHAADVGQVTGPFQFVALQLVNGLQVAQSSGTKAAENPGNDRAGRPKRP